LANGYQVVGIDNLNDAYDVALKQWRLDQLLNKPQFEFHRLDVVNRQSLEEWWNAQSIDFPVTFDAVIHLAARAGVRPSLENPWIYYETNVIGTLNLLELCRQRGVRKFVLASSSSLYGMNTPRPFREDASTDMVLSPYAASKKAAEVLGYTYAYQYGMSITALRYFTVYGPAGRPDMMPFRFVQWISEGKPVSVFGDGTQLRDFTFVDDIARGTIASLGLKGFEIINLGTDAPIMLMDAIKLIEELLGIKAQIEFKSKHPADVLATWADIGKAETLLHWRPQIKFGQGIAQLVQWYQANRLWAKNIDTGR
jgi:UDP-glucuronate 4-epimerase